MAQPPGARTLDPDRTRKRPWWLWALLAVAGLLLLLLLLSRCGGDDDAETTAAAPSSASPSSAAPSSAAAATPRPPSGVAVPGGAAGGSLTAGGTTLLPLPAAADGTLTQYVGQSSEGAGVIVQSVPADEGFWVGTSETDRVWVQLTGTGESSYTVAQGDAIDFSGEVVATPEDFATRVGVDAAEGAEQLTTQGAHLEVPRDRLVESA